MFATVPSSLTWGFFSEHKQYLIRAGNYSPSANTLS